MCPMAEEEKTLCIYVKPAVRRNLNPTNGAVSTVYNV